MKNTGNFEIDAMLRYGSMHIISSDVYKRLKAQAMAADRRREKELFHVQHKQITE